MKTRSILSAAILMLAFGGLSAAENKLDWVVGESASENETPKSFYAAEVPGAVQLDFAKALNYPDYRYADNVRQFDWLEDRFFTYRTSFPKVKLGKDERLLFKSESIDYKFKIYLNGHMIHSQEGMFTPVELDLTDLQKDENTLSVIVFPAPKADRNDSFGKWAKDHRTLARKSVKPPVSYGWDWHPRLVNLGICGETKLVVAKKSRIGDFYVNYSLNEDFSSADITLETEGVNIANLRYKWTLKDAEGKIAASKEGIFSADNSKQKGAVLNSPKLWWPNGYGTPYLYKSEISLIDTNGKTIETRESKIGFRSVKLAMNSGAWNEPKEEIKTRSVPPMQLVVNGKKIFMKGSNWLSPEVFPAKVSDETYDILTDYAVELNFNIFRMWGGAPVAREKFFELCDQKGIMVWQEFTMACNQYPDDEAYLKVLEQEAVSIIKRLRKHPSLTRWTCGNELFNGWSCMTEQSLALRTLDALTLRLSPQIPFNFTSPVMGVGHGPYYFLLPKLKPAEDMFQVFARSRFTLYCEFGISSMSPIETIKKIIPENERFPIRQSPAWATHHAYKSTTPNPYFEIYDVHCNKRVVSLIFGEPKTLEEHIENSQFLQAQGYKFIFEETRRQKPYCSGGINWCYNDAWESAANQSIIAYPHIKKPAFEAVKVACRPFLFSAKPEKFTWKAGEIFPLQIFALNDSHDTFEPMKVVVKAIFDGKEQLVGNWTSKSVKPYSNLEGPKFEIKIPNMGDKVKRFKIVVEAEGRKEYSSEYEFVYNPRFELQKTAKK